MNQKIKVTEYPNDNGYILNTFGYEDLESRPIKKCHLELYNFQALLQRFLTTMTYPLMQTLSPVLKWKLCKINLNQIATMQGPGFSSADGN